MSYRNRGLKNVSVAFFGDGASQQGILYEAMNMAALWKLPVVFCCINNQYGMGTRIDRAAANTNLHERAIAFGLNGVTVDGGDVEEVHEASERIFTAARNGKPGFIAMTCYRFFGHARLDKSPYRDEAEEARRPQARCRRQCPRQTHRPQDRAMPPSSTSSTKMWRRK